MMDARKREVTDRVMHRVSFPHRPSIAISSFRGVRSRCRARGHAILLRENSKYVYIYVTSEIRAQSRTRGMRPARRRRADRGRNSDAKDNVEEFTFRS